MATDYLDQLREFQFVDPPSVARTTALALEQVQAGALTGQLPVRFFNGTPPGPTQSRFIFDDNVVVPGWTGIWMGANAVSPAVGNLALAVKDDDTTMQIGSAAIGLLLLPIETEMTGGLVVSSHGIYLAGSAFVTGDGQPWTEAVQSVDLSAGGTIVVDTPISDAPMLNFTGTLPGDTLVKLPNVVGAVWDCAVRDVNVAGFTLTFEVGDGSGPVDMSTATRGARLGVPRTNILIAFGAPV